MPLTGEAKKAYQRELMRKRREGLSRDSELEVGGKKSSGVVESEERANTLSEKIKDKIQEHKEDQRKAFEDMAFIGLQTTPPLIEVQHTKTDQLFENKKPGYWIFEKEVLKKECWYCGEGFETRLRLNKFCSPDHKDRWLTASLRMGKE